MFSVCENVISGNIFAVCFIWVSNVVYFNGISFLLLLGWD
jgi:hypothetical protein